MFHLLLKVLVIARKQKPFDGRERKCRAAGELPSNFIDRRGQFFGRNNPIDQSPSHRLVCRQHAVQKEQLLRPAVTDQAGHA